MFQRGATRPGARLGVSTGWILRARLKAHGVQAIPNVSYGRIDDAGLHYSIDGVSQLAAVDSVVICAGQESDERLAAGMRAAGLAFDVIGGARLASELDAARAIEEGTRLAWAI
jgi:2,4-dienoyl-CoA reductase (NADPH2)